MPHARVCWRKHAREGSPVELLIDESSDDIGRDAVSEMHKLFDWARTSPRGLDTKVGVA